MGARQRISKMLLRRGQVWVGPGETWSQAHLAWLSTIRFDEPLADVVFGEYLGCHQVLLARRDRLDRLIELQAIEDRWAPLVGRLRCLRGIDTLSAVGLAAEIGDVHAFAHPKRLASYLGLVPSEQSSGQSRRQGSITKAGSSHARRLLVEAAWRAQLRLHQRWAHLDGARGKRRTAVATAVARELACFVWEIARQPAD